MGVTVREKPKDSGIYWVFINHNGKRKSKKIGKDKRLANQIAKGIRARIAAQEFDLLDEAVQTFQEITLAWLKLPHDWKESTRETYVFNLEKHVFPVFGGTPINKIKRKDLKEFFDNLLINGMSANTATLVKAPIYSIFKYAIEREIVSLNPASGISIAKRKQQKSIEPFSDEDIHLFLQAVQQFLNGQYFPHFLCAIRTGLRIGELQALRIKNVNTEERWIDVVESWRRGRFTDTKNRGRRRVDISSYVADVLKQHMLDQKKLALKNGNPISEFVFPNRHGDIFDRQSFKNALDRCADMAELERRRIHDLRHTYATIRLLRGHNIGDVSYQLGHSSISITYDTYGHWIAGKFSHEIEELDAPIRTLSAPKTI